MKLILISAGHGGTKGKSYDPGACGNGSIEADVALEMRDRVATILRAEGYSVLTDGADGVNEPLTKAITLAHRSDIAVEFHLNGSENPQSNGVECLSLSTRKLLAQNLCKAITGVTGAKTRGKEFGWIDQSAGAHHRLGFCMAGGIIVEFCFISNKTELETFLDKRAEVARSVADVIKSHAGAVAASDLHVVAEGETLYRIAKGVGKTVEEVMRLNSLATSEIRIGQQIRLK